jgi:hypothetical protein
MIDEIRSLALSDSDCVQPKRFRPGCQALDCSEPLGGTTHIDFEQSPPVVYVLSGEAWEPHAATDSELSAVLTWLQG